jgi:hypothetical protein
LSTHSITPPSTIADLDSAPDLAFFHPVRSLSKHATSVTIGLSNLQPQVPYNSHHVTLVARTRHRSIHGAVCTVRRSILLRAKARIDEWKPQAQEDPMVDMGRTGASRLREDCDWACTILSKPFQVADKTAIRKQSRNTSSEIGSPPPSPPPSRFVEQPFLT